ncbi:MAG TPA: HDIG domain-containing protein, partial [Phycisphaerae bacterium]|nr:HDIG domain-containing protein [Phycisphaerae bacterium]
AAAFVASGAAGLTGGEDVGSYVLPHAAAAAFAALLAGFIVLGVLPGIERLFGVATSLTLLEWCDANKPLLRRLAQEAPGTHIHSLTLGTIAESAADAIGANGLLTRVGALYHDIGKIAKPEYYVENQEAKINRHDRLGPTLSLLVIVAHVRDGLELAREYGLPKVLHQFIAEHHGTTVVRYFQRMAAEQAQKSKLKELPESEFRYPGPKPRTRETAVLMICDGVEGAVRALPEPTPGRIETTVHQIVMDRLNDGQFDDCDITLKDLSRVEEAVVKGLCAAYHGRIAYPKDASKEAAGAAQTKINGEKKTAGGEVKAPAMAIAGPTEAPRP